MPPAALAYWPAISHTVPLHEMFFPNSSMNGLTPTRSLLPVAVSAGSGATDGVHVAPDRVSTSRPVPPALVR